MCETDIGKRLVGLRIIKGVSQDTVAEACNISRVALSRYENGTRMPRIEISSRLAEYYGVSVDYLLGKTVNEKNLLLSLCRTKAVSAQKRKR